MHCHRNSAAFPDVAVTVGLMNHKEQVVDDAIRAQFKAIYVHLPNVSLHVYENGRFPGAAENWTRSEFGEFKTETCFAPASYFTIDAKGDAALCCVDQNTQHRMGNVAEKTLHEIWFNKDNQNMFRRIALGLSGCPSVCYSCSLKPSRRKLENVEPALYGSFEVLIGLSRAKRESNDLAAAQHYLNYALLRDPWNKAVKAELTELETLTGSSDRGYFQKYQKELEAGR